MVKNDYNYFLDRISHFIDSKSQRECKTQEDIADEFCTSRSTVSRFLNKEKAVTLQDLVVFADEYGQRLSSFVEYLENDDKSSKECFYPWLEQVKARLVQLTEKERTLFISSVFNHSYTKEEFKDRAKLISDILNLPTEKLNTIKVLMKSL